MKVCPEPHLRTVAGRQFENVAGITAIGAYLMPNATLYPLMPLNLYVIFLINRLAVAPLMLDVHGLMVYWLM